jgi:hypothetical protein
MPRPSKTFVSGVVASLVAAAVVGMIQHIREAGKQAPRVYGFSARVGDPDRPTDEGKLIDFFLGHERDTVYLDIRLDPEVAKGFGRASHSEGLRHYSLALSALPAEPLLMDVLFIVKPGDDFFFGVGSDSAGTLRGTFRVTGCVQTGTGWFACDLRALTADAAMAR